jgi:hypothetical protein
MNERGQYGARHRVEGHPHVGAEVRSFEASSRSTITPSRSTITPWMLGGVGLAAVGLALLGVHTAKRPRLSAHEKEVKAWEAEFPGLPWYMDRVKDARQLDMWERARDHWERTH